MPSKKRILLVEDDIMLSEMYMMVLGDDGYEVTLVRDGRKAIESSLETVDLVLLDIRMPEVDGLEVLRKYRERGFIKPIVILTNTPQVSFVQARELGADDFLVKSHAEIEDVLKVMEKYL